MPDVNRRPRTPWRGVKILSTLTLLASLVVVYRFFGDRTIWTAWIVMAPPLLWSVLLLPTALRLRSVVVLLGIAAFTAMTMEWPRWSSHGGQGEPAADETLRLVSWNIGAGNGDWSETVRALEPQFAQPCRLCRLARVRTDPFLVPHLPGPVV